MPSIALGINFADDVVAMRGLLEIGARYFDNIFTINSTIGGAPSKDGSVELVHQFGGTVLFDDIQKGFGYIRTRLIHECGCDWVYICDCDERFLPLVNMMTCEGTDEYPRVQEPNLKVTVRPEVINQGAQLRHIISNPDIFAVRMTRRHWFDFTMRKPTQNWMLNRDHQLRCVRNVPEMHYETKRVMHERLMLGNTFDIPYAVQDDLGGIFTEHHHMHFRRTQPGKKEHNEMNYSRLERGEKMIV